MKQVLGFLSMVAVSLAVLTGCEGGGGGGGGESDGGSFVGTWALYSGTSVEGTPAWYVHFNADGTFTISNNADGSAQRVSGTYSVTDGALTGPFTNPGVGDGRVEATIENDTLSLDFIEYWHTPNKVVHYTGVRI